VPIVRADGRGVESEETKVVVALKTGRTTLGMEKMGKGVNGIPDSLASTT